MLAVQSCTKELDEVVPQDAISKDQALKDPNAARTLYHGVYGRFRAYNSTFFSIRRNALRYLGGWIVY